MKIVLLGLLVLGAPSAAEAARKPASVDACRAHAFTAVETAFGAATESRVKTVTTGEKYEVTVRASEAEDEVTYEAVFLDGCDRKPEIHEVAADEGVLVDASFGLRCLKGEVYHQGQCCKRAEGGALSCPPHKPGPHLHDLQRH